MKSVHITGLLMAVIIYTACSSGPETSTALVEGKITVADSVDSSGDFSGIGITIINKDSANADADTLFHQLTDSSGTFFGTASFRSSRRYPLIISRNGQNLGSGSVILADKDTVRIKATLPDLASTFSIDSREHRALETYQRVDKSFRRVARFASMGRIKGDTLETELKKWSGLYWEVYEKYKGTLAARLAADESVKLLQGWNNDAMMKRIRSVQNEDDMAGLAATYGKDYLAQSKGLDYTVQYLDTLQRNTDDPNVNMRIRMELIKLLYDSARVGQAKVELEDFRQKYNDRNEAKDWIKSISYDLNYLSRGDSIPDFSFTADSQRVSRESMLGTPYVLEITSLSNKLYQQQFDRSVVIHSLYKNYGLQFITIPLDKSQVTIDAFFQERIKPWPVADAGAFDRQKLLKRFNIHFIPTRFLVGKDGRIVRKYVGDEFKDVIQGIQTLTKKDEPAS